MSNISNRKSIMADEHKYDTPERISAVERDVLHLNDAVQSLGHRFQDGFEELRDLIQNQRQPFTAFAGWASVMLILVGAVIYPLIQTEKKLETHLIKLSEAFLLHVQNDTTNVVQLQVDMLGNEVILLNDNLDVKIHDLNEHIQIEFNLLLEIQKERIKALSDKLDSIEDK